MLLMKLIFFLDPATCRSITPCQAHGPAVPAHVPHTQTRGRVQGHAHAGASFRATSLFAWGPDTDFSMSFARERHVSSWVPCVGR